MVTVVTRRGIRVSCLWDDRVQRAVRRQMAWRKLKQAIATLLFGV
jgi:hypothetical protein